MTDCAIATNIKGGGGKNYPPFPRPRRLLAWAHNGRGAYHMLYEPTIDGITSTHIVAHTLL